MNGRRVSETTRLLNNCRYGSIIRRHSRAVLSRDLSELARDAGSIAAVLRRILVQSYTRDDPSGRSAQTWHISSENGGDEWRIRKCKKELSAAAISMPVEVACREFALCRLWTSSRAAIGAETASGLGRDPHWRAAWSPVPRLAFRARCGKGCLASSPFLFAQPCNLSRSCIYYFLRVPSGCLALDKRRYFARRRHPVHVLIARACGGSTGPEAPPQGR